MIDWRPIETAPMDTPCLVTDGEYFAVGKTWLFTESPTIGYDHTYGGTRSSVFGNTEKPNPRAGESRWIWMLNGCTAYSMDSSVGCDWNQEMTDFIPTHWADIIDPPATELQREDKIGDSDCTITP